MNMKTTMGLVALCLLATVALAPTSTAMVSSVVCVTNTKDFTVSSGSCGPDGDWVTFVDDNGNCYTSRVSDPTSGCGN